MARGTLRNTNDDFSFNALARREIIKGSLHGWMPMMREITIFSPITPHADGGRSTRSS